MADTKPVYYVPAVGTKGSFSFQEPFDSILFSSQEYEVKSIRSLKEIYDSEEDPYTNIYAANNISEEDFKTDLDNNIPIIVLANSANQYYYVPATKLASLPKVTGVKYQECMMVINLGYLPLDFNIDTAKDTIINDIKASLGIESTVETIKTSSIQLVEEDKHDEFQKLLNTRKTITESYRTRYMKISEKYTNMKQQLDKLHKCIEAHIFAGLPLTRA